MQHYYANTPEEPGAISGRSILVFGDPDNPHKLVRGSLAQAMDAARGGSASMLRWRNAIAQVRRGTRNGKLALVGDSTTRGQGSASTTGQGLNGYPVQLSQQLAAHGLPSGWQNLFGTGNTTITSFDSRIALTGTFTTSSLCVGGQLYRMAAAATFAYTPTVNCNTFDVYSVNNGTGQFTINLDGGGTLATVNTTTSGSIVKTTVSGTLAGHTLNCVWVSGACYILGVDSYDSATKQMSCWNLGWLSSTTANWTMNTPALFDPVPALRDYLQPDLVVLSLGINDWTASAVSQPTYGANLSSIIFALQPTMDLVLVTPPPSGASVALIEIQQGYVNEMLRVGRFYGVPVIDLWRMVGSYTAGNGVGFYADTKHMSQYGYCDWAGMVRKELLRVA